MYYLYIDYFDVAGVSSVDGLNYPAGSLVAYVQYGLNPANLSFVSSSVFTSDKTLTCSFDILDSSSVSHVLSVSLHSNSDFEVIFDLPYHLFVTSRAFSFLYSFNAPDIGGSSNGGFSVPSLNGNCGSLPDGSIVLVTGLSGEFNVVASQFVWNDSTAQMSMIMYNLSKDGNFCLVPDVYVSAKAS